MVLTPDEVAARLLPEHGDLQKPSVVSESCFLPEGVVREPGNSCLLLSEASGHREQGRSPGGTARVFSAPQSSAGRHPSRRAGARSSFCFLPLLRAW